MVNVIPRSAACYIRLPDGREVGIAGFHYEPADKDNGRAAKVTLLVDGGEDLALGLAEEKEPAA